MARRLFWWCQQLTVLGDVFVGHLINKNNDRFRWLVCFSGNDVRDSPADFGFLIFVESSGDSDIYIWHNYSFLLEYGVEVDRIKCSLFQDAYKVLKLKHVEK